MPTFIFRLHYPGDTPIYSNFNFYENITTYQLLCSFICFLSLRNGFKKNSKTILKSLKTHCK